MKYFFLTLLSCLFVLSFSNLFAQNCANYIQENKVVEESLILNSVVHTLMERGNYAYSIQLMKNDKGLFAKIYSKSGVIFNQGDEIIFMDTNKARKKYLFSGKGEMIEKKDNTFHYNTISLNLETIHWLASSNITNFYIKNNIDNELRKFSLELPQQTTFKNLASCFAQGLMSEKK